MHNRRYTAYMHTMHRNVITYAYRSQSVVSFGVLVLIFNTTHTKPHKINRCPSIHIHVYIVRDPPVVAVFITIKTHCIGARKIRVDTDTIINNAHIYIHIYTPNTDIILYNQPRIMLSRMQHAYRGSPGAVPTPTLSRSKCASI